MRLFKIAVALVAAALLLGYFAEQAHSTPGPRAASLRVWGQVPCHGDVKVVPGHLAPGQVGEARWWNGPQGRFDCTVTIDRSHLQHWRGARCQTLVHEFGHLLGREHSRNPRSPMYWKATKHNVPRVCR